MTSRLARYIFGNIKLRGLFKFPIEDQLSVVYSLCSMKGRSHLFPNKAVLVKTMAGEKNE